MLDLFCGRWGWSKAFAARGWECVGVDLKEPEYIPQGCRFIHADVRKVQFNRAIGAFAIDGHGIIECDFVCASSACDGFASFGMPHFRPNPPYPALEIELFNHTRKICEQSKKPYVMENVRSAESFVGAAVNHCGPFYLWGSAVPLIMPQGISKAKWYRRPGKPGNFADELNLPKSERKAKLAEIPPELANCVADYAERLLEQNSVSEAGERVGGSRE